MSAARSQAGDEPVAALLREGRRRFLGVELLVAPGALVPRSETELLGRTALALLGEGGGQGQGQGQGPGRGQGPRIIDMCCGAGNLACALAVHLPAARVFAADVTEACVELAGRNVAQLGLRDRVQVRRGDLFAAFADVDLLGQVDVVVCNPPYISTAKLEGDRAPLLVHEPREAFDGGPFGITIHGRVVREALPFLRPGGTLLFEIGAGQERQVGSLFARARGYEEVREVQDDSGVIRVVLGRKRL